jgi:hypothetical protein
MGSAGRVGSAARAKDNRQVQGQSWIAVQDFLALRELSGRRCHSPVKLTRGCAIAALEQAVEVRNIARAAGEGDLRMGKA